MRRRERLFWIFVGSALFLTFFSLVPDYHEYCKIDPDTHQKNCARYHVTLFLAIHVGEALNYWGAAVTALATIAIAVFTFSLRQSTDKLWEAGERQIAISFSAVQANLRSVAVAESALKDIERAFVYCARSEIVQPDFPQKPDSPYVFNVFWKNSGNTRAIESFMHINWRTFDSTIDKDFVYPDEGNAVFDRIFIGPQVEMSSATIEIPHDEIAASMERRSHLYIWGWCEYDDIFEGTPRHRTEFCYKAVPVMMHTKQESGAQSVTMTFAFTGDHNGADDDSKKPVQTGSRKNPLPNPAS